jgi:hypothetical protein
MDDCQWLLGIKWFNNPAGRSGFAPRIFLFCLGLGGGTGRATSSVKTPRRA